MWNKRNLNRLELICNLDVFFVHLLEHGMMLSGKSSRYTFSCEYYKVKGNAGSII